MQHTEAASLDIAIVNDLGEPGYGGEWRVQRIGDLFELKPGFAFKSTDFKPSGVPVIKIKNVKAGLVVLDELSYVDEGFREKKKSFAVHHGDILITMSGTLVSGLFAVYRP